MNEGNSDIVTLDVERYAADYVLQRLARKKNTHDLLYKKNKTLVC